MPRFPSSLRRLRRSLLARRRPLAALLAALAVAAALRGQTGPPPRTGVLTAARDVAAGVVLGTGDLRRAGFAPGDVPAGALLRDGDAVGRTTTVPLRAGEPLTDARLLAAPLLHGYPGLVAVPVRVGDAGVVRLLHVGDRVDLLAADPQGGSRSAPVVASAAPVLAIPRPTEGTPGLTTGALVVLGVPEQAAGTVAQAGVSSFLSVVLTR